MRSRHLLSAAVRPESIAQCLAGNPSMTDIFGDQIIDIIISVGLATGTVIHCRTPPIAIVSVGDASDCSCGAGDALDQTFGIVVVVNCRDVITVGTGKHVAVAVIAGEGQRIPRASSKWRSGRRGLRSGDR